MDFTPVLNKSSNQIENLQNLSEDCHDKESFKGAFGWVRIFQKYIVPFIVRVINGERINFIPVKSLNIQKYLNLFRPDILKCAIVKSQCMTHTEVKLFNEINMLHYDNHYEKFSTKDYIVRYEDLSEFYKFTKFCYETLYHNTVPNEKYGFIQIDSGSVMPYIIIDSIKYTPLLCLESTNIVQQTMKITDWNLSYLKFCCKILGLEKDLYSSDSCDVISIDDMKRHFPPEAIFNEIGIINSRIGRLINYEQANESSSDRIEQSLGVVPATENITPHTSTTPVIPRRILVITGVQKMKSNQMGFSIHQGSNAINSVVKVSQLPSPLPSTLSRFRTRKSSSTKSEMIDLTSPPSSPAPNNQQENTSTSAVQSKRKYEQILHDTSQNSGCKGLLEKNQAGNSKNNSTLHYRQLPSPPPASPIFKTRRNSCIVAPLGLSEIQQGRNAINNIVNVPQLPSPSTSSPLSRLRSTKSSSINIEMIDLSSPPSSPAPNNQEVKVCTPISAVQFKIKSEQMLHDTSKNNAYKGLSEIQQGSSIMHDTVNIPTLPPPSPPSSTVLSILNSGRNSCISSEVIDLTSPPSTPTPDNQSSPTLSTQPEMVYYPMELNNEFEEMLYGTSRNDAYRIFEAIIHGKKVRCINREPNCYKNLMVNLEYLVRMHFPMCSVERCAGILTSQFKITVLIANTDQLALLFIQRKNVFENLKTRMMASLEDIKSVFMQLKLLINMTP